MAGLPRFVLSDPSGHHQILPDEDTASRNINFSPFPAAHQPSYESGMNLASANLSHSGLGQTNQQSQAGTLFGGSAQVSKPTLSFGTTSTTSQPSASPFGNTTTTSSQPTGGLFGAAPATQSTGWSFGNQSSGSGFGSTATTAPATGLFGASTSTQPQQGAQFGGALSQPKPGPFSGFNFGQQQTNSSSNPLFGASNPAPAQAKPSLFDIPNIQPQQQGSTLFGASSQPQQQTVPGVKIDLSNIKPTTRFSELNEDLQNTIIQIDNFIQQQMKWATEIQESMPARGAALETIPADVEYLTQRAEIVEEALDTDAQDIKRAKEDLAGDQDDARRCFNALENLKLPAQFHYTGLAAAAAAGLAAAGGSGADDPDATPAGSASDLAPYFQAKAKELRARLGRATAQLADIEDHMGIVEARAVEQFEKLLYRRARPGDWNNDEVRALVGTLRDFEDAILRSASRVGQVRDDVVGLTLGDVSGASTRIDVRRNGGSR